MTGFLDDTVRLYDTPAGPGPSAPTPQPVLATSADPRAVARAALDDVELGLLAHPAALGRTGVRGVELAAAALREQLDGGVLESTKLADALIVLDVADDDLFVCGNDPQRGAAQKVQRLRARLDAAEFPF